MKAPRLGLTIIIGLALCATFVGQEAQAVGAPVVNQCGQAVWGSPVVNVTEGFSESNSIIQAFQERSGVVLGSALPVDISPPAAYPTSYTSVASLTPSQIAPGTTVNSFFLYSDPIDRPTAFVRFVATVSFATPILGVIVRSATLNSTDAVVGSPGSTYSKNPFRGLELGQSNGADRIELLSPNTLHLEVATNQDIDSIRVITTGGAPGTTVAPTGVLPHYTEVASDGGIFNFGSQFFGSMGGTHLNQPMVGGSEACGTVGYWTVAGDGGIFSFGQTSFFGSTGALTLQKPVVNMAGSPDGGGYWLVASDGGIFAYGDASFYGSTGNIQLNKPIVGMKASPVGSGYWLFAADGGVFSFGGAPFLGSMGGTPLNQPVVGAF